MLVNPATSSIRPLECLRSSCSGKAPVKTYFASHENSKTGQKVGSVRALLTDVLFLFEQECPASRNSLKKMGKILTLSCPTRPEES